MSKLVNIIEENDRLVAKITGEVFVILNPPSTYDQLKKIADRLFREYPNMKTDLYIHCYIASNDLDDDNPLIGFKFKYNGKTYCSDPIFSMIPVGLLPAAEKETSVIKLSDVGAYYYNDDIDILSSPEIKIDIEITVTANQFKYRGIGRFEEVLKYVMNTRR